MSEEGLFTGESIKEYMATEENDQRTEAQIDLCAKRCK